MEIGQTKTIEVATGGDPAGAVAGASAPYVGRAQVFSVGVAHDDGCPCTAEGQAMSKCTCEIVELHIQRMA